MEIYLRTLMKSDAPSMLEWMHDSTINEVFDKSFDHLKISDCESFIEQSHIHDSCNLDLAISTEGDSYVGTVSLKHINHQNRSAEFAIVIHPKYQGQGIALQAMQEIGNIGFKLLGLKTIYLYVKKSNKRANALYKKYGCLEISAKNLEDRGINPAYPNTEEELNWYEFKMDSRING